MTSSGLSQNGLPPAQGLYDPRNEHDACGVGFVCHMKGKKSHKIVADALQILENLDHRGACVEENTGDGAGILIQMPHKFLAKVAKAAGFELPAPGQYGVANVFTSRDPEARKKSQATFEKVAAEEGMPVIGWRDLPTDNSTLGKSAKASEPVVRQVFVKRPASAADDLAFERKLYVLRKVAHNAIRVAKIDTSWYAPSMSCRTLVYKGMLTPAQVGGYYLDLSDADMESALALVHSRFSTNTFPNWERSTPTATSPTTARSTPCAATSTGCSPASPCSPRSCSETTSRRSSRSSTSTAPTPPSSTTVSSSWCSAAARCRTP